MKLGIISFYSRISRYAKRSKWLSPLFRYIDADNWYYRARGVTAVTKMKLGIPTPLRTEGRQILEQVVLPYFVEDSSFHRILFVGCEYYTWHYQKIFQTKEYWTIEPNVKRAKFGAKRHIIGYLRQIGEYFEENSLDSIICIGVLGFGLNDPQEIENSFGKCFFCLREGGILVLGWNDFESWSFLPPDKYRSLQQFHPFMFPPLKTSKYSIQNYMHTTFSFYIKPTRHVQ